METLILHATSSWQGILAFIIFVFTYILVIAEEHIHLKKSKPVIVASGVIWILVALFANQYGLGEKAGHAVKHTIEEYAELLLFLLVAMTFVNVLHERGVFDALRSWILSRGFGFKKIFWATGLMTFFVSPVVDNLTAALIMFHVVLAVGKGEAKFISLSCINIVIAANAGGAYSPFGDITTLMVWQKGFLGFFDFFNIFVPSLVSYLVPAICLSFYVPNLVPLSQEVSKPMLPGALMVMALFAFTLFSAVSFQFFLHLPPVLGMMSGLGLLGFYSYYLQKSPQKRRVSFDLIKIIESAEWDTLLFFYGVILCVSGLATLGYLQVLSAYLYNGLNCGLPVQYHTTIANVGIGLLSAVLDNIPVVYAVLTMAPEMSHGQWLLVTLTAGIGGSLLSIGSAAGVALMGQAKGHYTFFSHLKWMPIILLGYAAAILTHLWMNSRLF